MALRKQMRVEYWNDGMLEEWGNIGNWKFGVGCSTKPTSTNQTSFYVETVYGWKLNIKYRTTAMADQASSLVSINCFSCPFSVYAFGKQIRMQTRQTRHLVSGIDR